MCIHIHTHIYIYINIYIYIYIYIIKRNNNTTYFTTLSFTFFLHDPQVIWFSMFLNFAYQYLQFCNYSVFSLP